MFRFRYVVLAAGLGLCSAGITARQQLYAQMNPQTPPAKTPEEATALFLNALRLADEPEDETTVATNFASGLEADAPEPSMPSATDLVARSNWALLGHERDVEGLVLSVREALLRSNKARQWKTQTTYEKNNAVAIVEAQPNKTPQPLTARVICVAEDGGWRVDALAMWRETLGMSEEQFKTGLESRRETARRSACQSNLKQLALGFAMYVQDYDEKLPPARQWNEVLQPYVKSSVLFTCPAAAHDGYAMNSKLSLKNINGIDSTADTVTIYETPELKPNAFGMGEKIANRHLNGSNYAFADGHVKWFKTGRKLWFNFNAPPSSFYGEPVPPY